MRDDQLRKWTAEDEKDAMLRPLMNTAVNAGFRVSSLRHDVLKQQATLHLFNHALRPRMTVSDQMATGRCWMFAGLGLLRRHLGQRLPIPDDFAFSATHLTFYEKLEKAHAFLWRMSAIMRISDDLLRDRLLHHVHARQPIYEGGRWMDFVQLVNKYGVVPTTVMPNTVTPGMNTTHINHFLRTLVLQESIVLNGTYDHDLPIVTHTMRLVHRMLCIAFGTPPSQRDSFEWTYRTRGRKEGNDDDDEGCLAEVTTMQFTPRGMYAACGVDLRRDYVSLSCVDSYPFERAYSVEYGTVVDEKCDGGAIPSVPTHYNVPIGTLVHAAYQTLSQDRSPVWFTCEYAESKLAQVGLLHHDLVDSDALLGVPVERDRKKRSVGRLADPDHAMLLTGFHMESNRKITRWQVENSHGDDATSEDGYLSMTTEWFHRHVHEVAVPRKFAPGDIATYPHERVPPWSPFGTVAWW